MFENYPVTLPHATAFRRYFYERRHWPKSDTSWPPSHGDRCPGAERPRDRTFSRSRGRPGGHCARKAWSKRKGG